MTSPDKFRFELTFTVALCDCGTTRPLSTRCACGAPAGVDEPLEARRNLVRRVFSEVVSSEPDGTPGETDARAWFRLLDAPLSQLFSACQLIADDCGSSELLDALSQIETLRADARATPRLRPYIAPWRVVDAIIESLIEAADQYLVALTVPERDEAVHAGERAQASIDLAAELLDDLNKRQDRWESWEARIDESDSAFDPLLLLVESVWSADPKATITEFDASGQYLVARVTGGVELPSLGVGFRIVDAQAEALMDPERLWTTAQRTYRFVTSSSSSLEVVAGSPHWHADVNELTQELVDMGVELRRAQFDVPRRAARTFIRTGHLLTERVGKYLLATVLAAGRNRDYETLRSFDVGALLSEARQVGLSALTRGWDKALRHGDAHKLFVVEDDGVRFTAEKREYDFLTWDELVDRVLSAYESVLAVHAGLMCALGARGIDVPDPLLAVDIADEDRIRLGLAALGWTDVTVDLTATNVRVCGNVGVLPASPAFAAGSVTSMPAAVEWAEFTLACGADTATWAGPLAPLRTFAGEHTELGKQSRLLEVLSLWTLDGAPVMSTTRIRGHVAACVVSADESPVAKLAVLDVLAASARRLKDRDLVETLGRLRRGYEALRNGRQPAPSFKKAIDSLVAYYEAAADADRAA